MSVSLGGRRGCPFRCSHPPIGEARPCLKENLGGPRGSALRRAATCADLDRTTLAPAVLSHRGARRVAACCVAHGQWRDVKHTAPPLTKSGHL